MMDGCEIFGDLGYITCLNIYIYIYDLKLNCQSRAQYSLVCVCLHRKVWVYLIVNVSPEKTESVVVSGLIRAS